ncbi:MAG: pyrroline-5-carboxylate reductase [Fibrobacteria bacterium]|nr:pyrroline-5-carboxylate reductase [Fibrobacteria bacterium]
MPDFNKISILGCGNMGAALIRGAAASEDRLPTDVFVYDTNKDSLAVLADECKITPVNSLDALLNASEVVVSAVKPQIFLQIAPDIAKCLTKGSAKKILISIMAGLTVSKIESLLEGKFEVVRTMPNLPLSVFEGATAIATDGHSGEIISCVENFFRVTGKTSRVQESLLDAVTGLSGSGPMYVFEFVDGLISAGCQSGLNLDVSKNLAMQTIKGALALLEQGTDSPGDWTKKVCSPGGTTLAGLAVLENEKFKPILVKAVKAAVARSQELGKG